MSVEDQLAEHEMRIECIEKVIGKIPLRENALELERNKLVGKEKEHHHRSVEDRLAELETKVNDHDAMFIRAGEFIDAVGKAACDANRPEPEEKK